MNDFKLERNDFSVASTVLESRGAPESFSEPSVRQRRPTEGHRFSRTETTSCSSARTSAGQGTRRS